MATTPRPAPASTQARPVCRWCGKRHIKPRPYCDSRIAIVDARIRADAKARAGA